MVLVPQFYSLEWAILVFAWRMGETRPVCLVTYDIHHQAMLAKSFVPLQTGEMITLDLQLMTVGTVRVSARVDQVSQQLGAWFCLISFTLDPSQTNQLNHYFSRFLASSHSPAGVR